PRHNSGSFGCPVFLDATLLSLPECFLRTAWPGRRCWEAPDSALNSRLVPGVVNPAARSCRVPGRGSGSGARWRIVHVDLLRQPAPLALQLLRVCLGGVVFLPARVFSGWAFGN